MPINNQIINQKGTPAFYSDIFANRPTYGYAGRVFISTDTGAIYEDTGTSWTLIADAGAGTTGTLQQVTTNGSSTTIGLSTSGNGIGIGTTIPTSNRLDIHSSSGINATFNGTGVTNSALQLQSAGVGKWNILNNYNAGANSFQVYDVLNSTARLTILNTGATTLNTSLLVSRVDATAQIFLERTNTAAGIASIGADDVSSFCVSLSPYTTKIFNVDRTGNVTATSFIKSGGTSAQILAADGSVITAGTNITISGGTIAFSGSSMAIGGSITSATAGSILFAGTSGVLAQNNANFFWDNTNVRLGIGTNSFTSYAGQSLVIAQSNSGNMGISIDNTYTTTASGTASVFLYNGGVLKCRYDYARDLDAGIIGTTAAIPMLLFANASERMRITSTGNIGIGTTTIGSKFQVNGSVAIGYSASTAAPTNGISVSGTTNIGTNTSVTTALLQVASTTQGFLPPVMTTTQKNAITSPATGLMVFDTTLGKLCVFSTTWQTITSV